MKKKLIAVFILLILLESFLSACQKDVEESNPAGLLIGTEKLEQFHTNRLVDKESPYTMCFENSDGTKSLYIFTSPVSYYDSNNTLQPIDTSLISVTDSEMKSKGYSLVTKSCDIKSYFPKDLNKTSFLIQGKDNSLSFAPASEFVNEKIQKSTFTDLIGREHSSAVYQKNENIQIEYVPTTAGIMANISIKEKPENNQLDFYIDKQEKIDFTIKDNEYVVFKTTAKDSVTKAIIYTSFLQDSAGKCSFNNTVQVIQIDNQWKYSIKLDESFLNDPNTQYPINISPTFELYRNKMPDSTVYSNKPSTNVYLANYAVLGNNEFYGNSQHYLRFRINYVFKSYEQNIKSAVYVSTVLTKDSAPMQVEMLRLKDIWSSTGINWITKFATLGNESSTQISAQGRYEFDITNFVKLCVKDDEWNTEVYGLAMTAAEESTGTKVIATNDNTFYQPYIRIDFYDMPWTFEKLYTINPDAGF